MPARRIVIAEDAAITRDRLTQTLTYQRHGVVATVTDAASLRQAADPHRLPLRAGVGHLGDRGGEAGSQLQRGCGRLRRCGPHRSPRHCLLDSLAADGVGERSRGLDIIGIQRHIQSPDHFPASSRSSPVQIGSAALPSVILVSAIGEIGFALTLYLAISQRGGGQRDNALPRAPQFAWLSVPSTPVQEVVLPMRPSVTALPGIPTRRYKRAGSARRCP